MALCWNPLSQKYVARLRGQHPMLDGSDAASTNPPTRKRKTHHMNQTFLRSTCSGILRSARPPTIHRNDDKPVCTTAIGCQTLSATGPPWTSDLRTDNAEEVTRLDQAMHGLELKQTMWPRQGPAVPATLLLGVACQLANGAWTINKQLLVVCEMPCLRRIQCIVLRTFRKTNIRRSERWYPPPLQDRCMHWSDTPATMPDHC